MAGTVMISPWIGIWNAEVAAAVRLMGSRWAMLAEGAWDHAGDVMAILGPEGNLILRDTYQWLGGDEGVNKMLLADPVGLAHMLAAHMLRARARFPAAWNVWIHDLNEPPTTTHEQRVALALFTITFMADIHAAGERGIGLNCGEGNPPGTAVEILEAMEDLREAAEACDKVGWHMYENTASPGKWSAFRYHLFPTWWPRDRHLPTECGFETPTGGWRRAIGEGYATGRMLEIAGQWARDGLKDGGLWFAVGVQNEGHFETYLGTPEMYRQFGEANAAEIPPPSGGNDMAYDPHVIWDDYFGALEGAGYNPNSAIGKYRMMHPELNVPISGEIIYGDMLVRFFTGGVVYVRKGDWDNVRHATTMAQFPPA